MATPIVELSISDRVDDQSFLRNGNFYSSFWTNPAGLDCPVGVDTSNADYWTVNPSGADVHCLRSTNVPDTNSLFSMEIQGNAGSTDCLVSQIINADLSSTMRRICTFSGYIYNGAGLSVSPKLEIWANTTFNNFNTLMLVLTADLQTCADGLWTFVSVSIDLSTVSNIENGMRPSILIPSGALSATTKMVAFSRIKFQIGEIATEFVDDVGLFVQTPSVDSTMLQDGCIARPSLFLPNVIPSGAFEAKAIVNGDISDGAIDGRTLIQSATTTVSAPGFVQPAVGAQVPITVGATTGFVANQPIVIVGGGAYTTFSITDATHMVVINSGGTNNAAPAANVPAGGNVYQAGAAIESLGYVPINKAGDSGIGPAPLAFANEVVVGANAYSTSALIMQGTTANAANDGYMPAISFVRQGRNARAIGLDINNRFKTIDASGGVGWLLDTVTGVPTANIQNGAVTLPKLGADVIAMIIPPGKIGMHAGPSPPAGWFLCDGSAVSRTTYAALFAAIGTYWGVGDNSTTFNIPDLRGRSPLGYVNTAGSGLSGRAFASRGGEENHVNSIAEMPAHDHQFGQSAHAHTITNQGSHTHGVPNPFGTTLGVQGGASQVFYSSGIIASTSSSISGATDAANANINFVGQGGNAAHNNMSPFAVLYFIVKY